MPFCPPDRLETDDQKKAITPTSVDPETEGTGQFKITGDTDITVTNTRSTQDIVFEKTLEDSDEQEVVEEIQVTGSGEYLRRKRTIIWDKTTYGRCSRSIKYKKLPIGKKLYHIIQNTLLPGWKYASIS